MLNVAPGYELNSWNAPALAGGLCIAVYTFGFLASRVRPAPAIRILAWLLATGAVAGVHFIMRGEPAGLRMVALCCVLMPAMKAIVSTESLASGDGRLPALRWLAWATAWPGMRPAVFMPRKRAPDHLAARRFALWGLIHLFIGGTLIFSAWMVWVHAESRVVATLLLMPGLSLCVHFGLFNLLAALWQLRGIDTRPLWRNPPAARTLGEFWSKRWNLAFSEMVAASIYRPVSRKFGAAAAVFAGFLFSGVLHEIAISLPVNAGYGLPTAYFALHGILVLLERNLPVLTRQVWLGRIWTLLWVLAPTPVLFHPWFLKGVVWPIIGMS